MTQDKALEILKSGNNVLLTGPAGTGKTFVLNKFIKWLKKKGLKTGITASTGIAATHINGTTIHSWAGFGIKKSLSFKDLKSITRRVYIRQRISQTNVLIIDEISMLHDYQLDMVDEIARKIRKNNQPFGGMQVVLSGDLFQLPPVDKVNGGGRFITDSQVFSSADFKICYLSRQYRQNDNALDDILSKIRSGDIDEAALDKLSGRYNKRVKNHHLCTKLYTHNADVDSINMMKLDSIKSEQKVYEMKANGNHDYAEKLAKNCLAPEKLFLKIGAVVMFVSNNFSKGYVNGTIGEVVGFEDDIPIVRLRNGKEVAAIRHTWHYEMNDESVAQITQVPLRLAWAITVHKSQGMTLDAMETDLSKAFTYGLGYVALSRVRNLDSLSLVGINKMALLTSKEAKEIEKELIAKSKLHEKKKYKENKFASEGIQKGLLPMIKNEFNI